MPLAIVMMSGVTPKYSRGERRAEPAEAGDHLVEDQQDAVLVADRAQPLQVALRRRQHAGRAGHRLDDHRGDGVGAVQRHEPLQLVGELGAVRRLAAGEGVARRIVGVRQVVDAGQQSAEGACGCRPCRRPRCRRSRRRDSRARARPGGCAAPRRARGDRRARSSARVSTASEPELVKKTRSRPGGVSAASRVGQLEGDRVAHLEGRRVVQLAGLALRRPRRSPAAVAGVDAPEAGGAVEHLRGRPRCSSTCPWRAASRRGSALNCRLAVNGIQ